MLIALVTALSLSPPPPTDAGTKKKPNELSANEVAGHQQSRLKRFAYAESLFHDQHFVESAVEFEALWREFQNSRYLYNAALARHRAGHLGHAAAYLAQYVKTSKTSVDQRTVAARFLENIRESLVVIEVRIKGAQAATVHATFHGGFPSQQRDTKVSYPIVDQRSTIYLDPGIWQLDAIGRGARAEELELVVRPTQDPARVEIRMESRRPKRRFEPERGRPQVAVADASLGLGFGILGAAFLGVGLSRSAHETQLIKGNLALDSPDSQEFGKLRKSSDFSVAGTGLIGVGVGLVGAGMFSLLKTKRRRRIAHTAALTLGVGVATVGAFATGFIVRDRDAVLDSLLARSATETNYVASSQRGLGLYQSEQGRLLGFSSVAGLGAGLALGSVIAMVAERARWSKPKKSRDKIVVTHSFSLVDNRPRIMLAGHF